jgi:sortase B
VGSLACFIYVTFWLVDGWSQKNIDKQMANAFHQTIMRVEASESESLPAGEEERMETANDLFASLNELNPDIIGWLIIEGTAVDYPVVQGKDNDEYLRTDLYGEASTRGTLFQDYRYTEDIPVNIIYGHHMRDGTMFRDVYRYSSVDFRAEHPEITFISKESGKQIYLVEDVLYWDLEEEQEQDFISYFIGLDENKGNYLALVTCDNTADDARLIVIARKQDATH